MLSLGTRKRLSRIKRRACPEVQAVFASGLISGRKADTLLYLPVEEQRATIARILAEREAVARRSRIATEIIRGYVEAGCRDLVMLQKDLRDALSHSA
jgi:ParB-like chromosome segregation protein Spo0J